jgi:glycosyltransferase involved in cell wall biosynthesis
MYPTSERPYYGTFVAEQVEGLRRLEDVEAVDVLFVDGRRSAVNYLRGIAELRRALSRDRYDIVHAHHGLAGAVAITQRSCPVVITFHGSDLNYYFWQRCVSRLAASWATANVCVSAGDVNKVSPRAVYVPCGIDVASFAPRDRELARRSFEISDDAIALLFPGPRTHPQKAYARFEEVRDALRARGRNVHELRLENVERSAVPDLLAAADVLVMTSVSEGSPVSVMEALAGGVPVVATDVGDVRAMIEGLPNCLVRPYDVDAFVRAIEQVVDMRPRQAATRSRRFEQTRIAAGLRAVYGEALSG